MLVSALLLVLGGLMLFRGIIPLGSFPFADSTMAMSSIFIRVSGLFWILAVILPHKIIDPVGGKVTLLVAGLTFLFIGMVHELSVGSKSRIR